MKDYKRIILCNDGGTDALLKDKTFNVQMYFPEGQKYLVSSRFIMENISEQTSQQIIQVTCDSISPIDYYCSSGRGDILGYYKNTELDARVGGGGAIFSTSAAPFLATVNSKSWRVQIMNTLGADIDNLTGGSSRWRLEITLESVDCDCD